MSDVIAPERLVAIGAKVVANLTAQADRNRRAGEAITSAIRAVLEASPHLTAGQVRQQLLERVGSDTPSLRRVQKYLQRIRAPSSVRRG